MSSTNEHAVKVLNDLIETTLDTAQNYKEAAEQDGAAQYKSLFDERRTRRLELSRQLQEEVRSFGGEPSSEQSAAGKLHNKITDLKEGLHIGGGAKAIIDVVERGEDVIKARFEKAVEDDRLPTTTRTLVTTAATTIRADHDEIARIKHQLH